jgi:serine phosphatase RsbU (regulator of sigma subunit)/HAMP domain-containing protein
MIRKQGPGRKGQHIPGKFQWGIGWRISVGFGVFGLAVGALFLLTRSTLEESQKLSQYIDGVLTPSIQSLEELDRSVGETRILIRHWLSVQSGPRDPEKRDLLQLMDSDVPEQVAAMQPLVESWNAPMQLQFDSLHRDVEYLFLAYSEVIRLLPDFRAYDDPLAMMEAEYYALDGSSIPLYTASIRKRMDTMSLAQTDALTASTAEMDLLSNRLKLYAGNVALGILILGFLIAWAVTRSIVRPIGELKRALLYLGRGVPLASEVEPTSDEIGEMAHAVNRLADGLNRTRAFSMRVGQGEFDADYEPLSADDALGHAILKMRDDLESNEQELEGKVQMRTAEVEQQKKRVESLYVDLKDSINYAERIQKAILPSVEDRAKVFEETAVFYRPRDGVSGDFYWFHSVGRVRMFSAIDCTGHGVPGAFMSLIGHNALERVTKVYTQPDRVLEQLNRAACELLRPQGFGEDEGMAAVQDGMDLAMATVDLEKMELEYSGANCPLYLVRKGMLQELKPDKMAIASFEPGTRSFEMQTVPLVSGDVIFVATDGFPDQFGGPKGKKFMRKRFRELLVRVAPMQPLDMENALAEAFNDWKGDEEQVDDVLVVGVRI